MNEVLDWPNPLYLDYVEWLEIREEVNERREEYLEWKRKREQ